MVVFSGFFRSAGSRQGRHIVTSSLVCCDINDFVHVARPCSSTRGSDGPA